MESGVQWKLAAKKAQILHLFQISILSNWHMHYEVNYHINGRSAIWRKVSTSNLKKKEKKEKVSYDRRGA